MLLSPQILVRRPPGVAVAAYSYTNAEAATVAAAFTTPPNNARALAIDTLVGALKTAGTWSKMDVLYLLAAADGQAARINWKNPGTNTLTVNGTAPFTADSGYKSDGSSGYLDVGAAYGSFSQLALNSAHLGAYTGGTVSGSGFWFPWGRASGSGRYSIGSSSGPLQLNGRLGVNTQQAFAASGIAIANAHVLITRRGSTSSEGYQNASSVGTSTDSSSDVGSGNAVILQSGGSTFSDSGFIARCVHFGSQLSGTEITDTYNAIHAYMQTVAGVA